VQKLTERFQLTFRKYLSSL